MPDLQSYLSTDIIVMALIVAAIFIIALLIYKLLSGRVRGRKGSRLGISEYHEIDKTRRLVLVRRDDMEHLMLIGGGQDVVIESGIPSPLMAPAEQPPPMRAAPRPPVFGSRRPTLRPVEPGFGPGEPQN